jgi:AcrR family transcriptional regulator
MTKHKSSDERREQILTAARKCFIERGYETTRMSDISRESGLSKGGIYFHFESKMHVFISLVDDEYETSMTELAEVAEGPGSMSTKLLELAQRFLTSFAFASDRPNFFVVMSEVGLREPVVKQKLLAMQNHYIDMLEHFLAAGVDSGEIRPVHPRSAAIFVKSLLDGLEGNTALGLDLDLQTLIPSGLDMLLNGLLQPQAAAARSTG